MYEVVRRLTSTPLTSEPPVHFEHDLTSGTVEVLFHLSYPSHKGNLSQSLDEVTYQLKNHFRYFRIKYVVSVLIKVIPFLNSNNIDIEMESNSSVPYGQFDD